MEDRKEKEYLEKLARGDHQSYEVLFLYYHPRLHHFLSGFIKDEEEAFDMAQDLFYKVWVNREKMTQVDSFKAYLFGMARNMIYNYYEHSLVKEKYLRKQQEKKVEEDPEEEISARDLSLLIELIVDQMPEQRKRVFRMSRYEGLSGEEIAGRLQINKRTVENHLSHAMADLKKVIRPFILIFM